MANEKYAQQTQQLIAAVAALQAGGQENVNQVYELSKNYVYKIINDIVKNPTDTEDLMQETYIQIYNSINSLQDPSAFYVWAGRIATNKTLRYINKNRHEVLADEDENGSTDYVFEKASEDAEVFIPESILDNREKQRLLANIIDSLSIEQKITIQYFYYEEMSVREIAEQMACSEGTVKSRLNYARKTIKEAVVDLDVNHNTRLYSLAQLPLFSFLFWQELYGAFQTAFGAGASVAAGAAVATGAGVTGGQTAGAVAMAGQGIQGAQGTATVQGAQAGQGIPQVKPIANPSAVAAEKIAKTGAKTGFKAFIGTAGGKAVVAVATAAVATAGVFGGRAIAKQVSSTNNNTYTLNQNTYQETPENQEESASENLTATAYIPAMTQDEAKELFENVEYGIFLFGNLGRDITTFDDTVKLELLMGNLFLYDGTYGEFTDGYVYKSYSSDELEPFCENLFNQTLESMTPITDDQFVFDGCYWIKNGDMGAVAERSEIGELIDNGDGTYTLTVDFYYICDGEETEKEDYLGPATFTFAYGNYGYYIADLSFDNILLGPGSSGVSSSAQESSSTPWTADEASNAVYRYCCDEYLFDQYPDMTYIIMGEQDGNIVHFTCRCYTGSFIYLDVDLTTGYAAMSEEVPGIVDYQDDGTIDLNPYNY